MSLRILRSVVVVLALSGGFVAAISSAQTKAPKGRSGNATSAAAEFDAGGLQVKRESRAPVAGPGRTDGGVPISGRKEAVEVKAGEGGTKVFRFGEVEIEGRLRSPQLVYFLRRVRAEFSSGGLGHRSFMGELSETRKEAHF